MNWTLAARSARLNPSIIREIFKVTESADLISLAGGLPSPASFPVEAVREATARVMCESPCEAMQYASSEGFGPLREWIAAEMSRRGLSVSASQVLVTSGSQQGLDLCGKLLLDVGATVAVESPTYLGALQAFAPYEPQFLRVPCDDAGPVPEEIGRADGARFMYLVPNFQNPSGRSISQERRKQLVQQLDRACVPAVEDDPYGDLWYDTPPPAPLAALDPDNVIHLGSFSKILAPGLRLGYLIAPSSLFPKFLQAKQAADLHTPGLNQRVAYEVLRSGVMPGHIEQIRSRYRVQRDAMQAALTGHLLPLGCRWRLPAGGMFFWISLPRGLDASALLPRAVAAGVAYVPGAAFYCADPVANSLRLSFVTVSADQIGQGIHTLRKLFEAALCE